MAIDVMATRERQRRKRLFKLGIVLAPLAVWLWWRLLQGNPVSPGWPHIPEWLVFWLPGIFIIALLGAVFILPMLGNGRSPHTVYLPEQIDIGFNDVKGLGGVVTEVRHTLEVFLNHKRFRDEMGGTPRRGVLFEGPPGTGKTYLAKAMAKEAGVPFLFVSATAFQSMWYGATARKIRSFFRDMRKIAMREGGAIGFIEEIDAIAMKRGGLHFSPATGEEPGRDVSPSAISEGVGGVVNELLVQMQSFDDLPRSTKIRNGFIGFINRYLPPGRQLKRTAPPFANVLLIAATNRADSLDPALLRPGRFDRILHFDLPVRADRRELVDYFLGSKAHEPGLDDPRARDNLASATMGYTPASLERLFDEALLVALRSGRNGLSVEDIRKAQMEVEIGLPNPVDYEPHERETIATHEAGHATVAYLMGRGRRLELLSIIKRRDSLGLLAHREDEERFTRRSGEMRDMIQISLGGLAAEELFFGESGTGPAGDLVAATRIAADMVGSFGLGGSLVSFRAVDAGLLGGNLVARVLGDATARAEVEEILSDAKSATIRLLSDHRYLVEALRDALLEREEIVEDEILEVLHTAESDAVASGRVIVDLNDPMVRITAPQKAIELQPGPDQG